MAFNEEPAGNVYTLQLAQDRSSDEQVERNFALLFIAVLFGGVVASALIAIVVTRRGLRPLQKNDGVSRPNRARPIEATYRFHRLAARTAAARQSLSTKCSNGSTIRLRGSRNSPPI